MKPIEAGDYFLLPYKGLPRDLLVKATVHRGHGFWDVVDATGAVHSMVLLSSCHRVSLPKALRILSDRPKKT